jgi:hypothetical protein
MPVAPCCASQGRMKKRVGLAPIGIILDNLSLLSGSLRAILQDRLAA